MKESGSRSRFCARLHKWNERVRLLMTDAILRDATSNALSLTTLNSFSILLLMRMYRSSRDFPGSAALQQHLVAKRQDRARHAAVDMHLVEMRAAGLCLDQHGRKDERDARRSRHDVLEGLQRLGRADGGNPAHVPDHGALGIEVGGDDQLLATFRMLDGHRPQHVCVDIAGDQLAQFHIAGGAVCKRYAE